MFFFCNEIYYRSKCLWTSDHHTRMWFFPQTLTPKNCIDRLCTRKHQDFSSLELRRPDRSRDASSVNTRCVKAGVGGLECPTPSGTNRNADCTPGLLAQIPTATLQTLVETLLGKVERDL